MTARLRWIVVGVVVVLVLAITWWLPLFWITRGDAVAGPCAESGEELGPVIERRGWGWNDVGFVCVRQFQDGRRERFVVRWFW